MIIEKNNNLKFHSSENLKSRLWASYCVGSMSQSICTEAEHYIPSRYRPPSAIIRPSYIGQSVQGNSWSHL